MPKAAQLAKFLQNCKGFDTVVQKVKFLSGDNGNCLARLKIGPEHLNPMGGLHGGLSTTLVDTISSFALFSHERGAYPSVSVNMNMTFMKGAVEGDSILIDVKTKRVGQTMAFLEVELRNEGTGDLLVKGQHTKYIMKQSPNWTP